MNHFNRSRLGLVPAAFLVALAVLASAAAAEPPRASFAFSPEFPRAGKPVRFVSSSCDPDGRLRSQAWDLDGDGAYDDAQGRVATVAYASPGPRSVGLRVTAINGATDVQRRPVIVDSEYALPRPDESRLLTPFPTVRLAGVLTARGARVRVLAVRGPACARAEVSCRGRSCPARARSRLLGRKRARFRQFQRHLSAGTVLTVRVSKGDRIGLFARFVIRKDRRPKRVDRCLRPGARRGSPCPQD